MALHTYNPISIIAALLANSRHRLHSALSHPHIRCNPHQPVPAGAPGWGSRVENSSLHWHPRETEQRTQISGSLNPPPLRLKSSLYQLCPLRARGRDGCSTSFPPTEEGEVCTRLLSLPSDLDLVPAAKLSLHNYNNARHRGSYIFHRSSIWNNSTSHQESDLPAFSSLASCWWQGDDSETLCFYSLRTAG